ncbi:MAG: hypothetical protein ACR2KT_15715 [Methylocella sp.]|nr:MAG: hypothetical protein DLM68_14135 [Hyphomicrobiales bacterium]
MGIEIDVAEQRESWGAIFTSAQFALRFCNFDHVEAEKAVHRSLDGGDIGLFDKMSADWVDDVGRLEALIETMKVAHARLAISNERVLARLEEGGTHDRIHIGSACEITAN